MKAGEMIAQRHTNPILFMGQDGICRTYCIIEEYEGGCPAAKRNAARL
jgi:hypothetical protein